MGSGTQEKDYLEIAERLQVVNALVTPSGGNLFSSNVPNGKVRFVALFMASGLGTSNTTLEIDLVPETGSNTTLVKGFNVTASGNSTIPPGGFLDLKNPAFVLASQQNLKLTGSSSSFEATAWYWDSP